MTSPTGDRLLIAKKLRQIPEKSLIFPEKVAKTTKNIQKVAKITKNLLT